MKLQTNMYITGLSPNTRLSYYKNGMKFGNKKNNKKIKDPINNRIKIVMAIVFLLGCATIYKLFVLQMLHSDYYRALAQDQHQIQKQLVPERGRILAGIYKNGSEDTQLSSIATNKEFAFVFAIPKDVLRPGDVAESLYVIFKKELIEKEVDELLEKQRQEKINEELNYIKTLEISNEEKKLKVDEVNNRYEAQKKDSEYQEFLKIKREAEIKLRKDKVMEAYLNSLGKKNDPYEPIEKKVDDNTLLSLYALLASSENKLISKDMLKLKEGKVMITRENGEVEPLNISGISYVMISYRYYPEKNIGSHILGFARVEDEETSGQYGLEGFFNDTLTGHSGRVKSEMGAGSNVIILNDREYEKPINGADIVLTIDKSVQYTVCNMLDEASLKHRADGGTIIIMEPNTGAIIAMCSWPDYDPNEYEKVEDINVYNNPAISAQYEPGSVFKTITMVAAIDQKRVTPETTYIDEGQVRIDGWNKPIGNSDYATFGAHGEVNMNTVLELSLNTGAIFAMRQIGSKVFADYVENFGFGKPSGIELSSEIYGNISNLQTEEIHEIYLATASFGQGITATPMQMVNSYATIANGGILMKPYIVKEIHYPDGTVEITKPKQVRRVVSERASVLVGGMLVNVVEGGHAILAAVPGYYVGGKTGTAQVASTEVRGYSGRTIHTFVGYAPIDEPKFVMLVKLDNPKDVAYSASSAAPLFGKVAEYLLNYYQVPKERDN